MLTMSKICKNCIKSKRDCAGYVQPLVYKQHAQDPTPDIRDPTGRPYPAHDDTFNSAYFITPLQHGQQFLGAYPAVDPSGALPYQQMHSSHYAQNTQMPPPAAVHQLNSGTGPYYGWQANQIPSQQLYHNVDTARTGAPIFQMPYQEQPSSSQLSLDPTFVTPSIYSESQSLSQDQTPLSAMNPSPHDFPEQRHFFEPSYHRPAFISQPYGVLQADIEGM